MYILSLLSRYERMSEDVSFLAPAPNIRSVSVVHLRFCQMVYLLSGIRPPLLQSVVVVLQQNEPIESGCEVLDPPERGRSRCSHPGTRVTTICATSGAYQKFIGADANTTPARRWRQRGHR